MERTIQIQPLDPLMIRDGRPFTDSPGARAHTLNTVTPSVVAGTLRRLMQKNNKASAATIKSAEVKYGKSSSIAKVDIRGPLYMMNRRLFLPMPYDLDLYEPKPEDDQAHIHVNVRRPIKPATGNLKISEGFLGTSKTSLHDDKLWPVTMDTEIRKPLRGAPAYVSAEWMIQWLCDRVQPQDWSKALAEWRIQESQKSKKGIVDFIAPFVKEVRTHTAIEGTTSTAKEKALFSTESLVLPPDFSLIAGTTLRADTAWEGKISGIHSFGGKRRLAHFQEIEDKETQNNIWKCPPAIKDAVAAQTDYLRMVLATPAYFSKGWLPGWLDENLKSTDKFDEQLQVQLCWACLPRWEGISGWSYNRNQPKAVRRMVAAGSVYFFKVVAGDPVEFVQRKWLASMSDEDRRKAFFDKQDGYGLATWGVWTPHEDQ
ncbi:type III-B CRISPR module-associated protein Cmr3 [Paenibacillus albidus]|uniref:type III-B CRISPR module-associated protein Cmr3 n=1 Tax=Paenibacillus albidus TaxID=2041023 RepID=UPI001BE5D44C|nr:type III-B CRISPR module-associated protein Cmr3 [Paenibacillus albidus]MBT2288282.1 type III-B CRISPR module-associated protein Cmr3 [Paenibacillus albidus]